MPNSEPQQPHFPVLERVLNSIADWVNNYRESLGHGSGLSRCDRDEVMQMAKDLGVSPGKLRDLANKGPARPTWCRRCCWR